MVHYNSEAGKLLKAANLGILRHHSEPDIEKLNELSQIDQSLEKMAFSSATYVTSDSPGRHWGLNVDTYAHASSPLRRYADLYNQRCLLNILKNTDIKMSQNPKILCRKLNQLQKHAKAFERDEFFISTLAKSKDILTPVVIEVNHENQYVKVWSKEWNRILRIKTLIKKTEQGYCVETKDGIQVPIQLKEKIVITYYVNYEKAQWKDKIIFEFHK
jgi:hypothetical protein